MRARDPGHQHDRHRGHGAYGNPDDLRAYVARQLDPARLAWQKPGAVLRALAIHRGQVVAEIGAGPGFWTFRLSRAVGPSGHVFAVEPEPVILAKLRERLERSGCRNVTPVLGRASDPMLPGGQCDVVLMVNTYHHLPDGRAFLRRLVRALRPGGRLVNIDFDRRETPVGPPVDHRVSRDRFLKTARGAGLTLSAEPLVLPYQYFLVLRSRSRARPARTAR